MKAQRAAELVVDRSAPLAAPLSPPNATATSGEWPELAFGNRARGLSPAPFATARTTRPFRSYASASAPSWTRRSWASMIAVTSPARPVCLPTRLPRTS
jgi:hypothetical protein